MESVSIKTSDPLVDSGGSTRTKPVSQLDVDVLESPREKTISQEGWQVRVKQRSLPTDIDGQLLSVGVRLVAQDGKQDRVGDFLCPLLVLILF